jgi:hypothetical protein
VILAWTSNSAPILCMSCPVRLSCSRRARFFSIKYSMTCLLVMIHPSSHEAATATNQPVIRRSLTAAIESDADASYHRVNRSRRALIATITVDSDISTAPAAGVSRIPAR